MGGKKMQQIGKMNRKRLSFPLWFFACLAAGACFLLCGWNVRQLSSLRAFAALCRSEGILPALESSHALAWVLEHAEKLRAELPGESNVVVNLSGRGDKDLDIVEKHLPL